MSQTAKFLLEDIECLKFISDSDFSFSLAWVLMHDHVRKSAANIIAQGL